MMKRKAIVCFSLALMMIQSSHASDWPSWRGASGNGISEENEAPLHWSATDNIAWKTPIPGSGTSSPIVVNGSIFLTTFDEKTLDRQLCRFDLKTGKLLWQKTIHRAPAENRHQDNSSASATPTSNGQFIFTVFVDDRQMIVSACDRDGEIVWKKDLGSYFSKHGFAASPMLCPDGLIVNGHQDGEAYISLLDPTSGETKWRHKPDVNQRSFSTPVVAEVDGAQQIILAGANRTVALVPSTGERLWYAEGPTEKVVATVSVGLGYVFSFGGSPAPKAFAIKLGGRGDVTNSHVVWSLKKGMPYVPTPLLYGNYLHVVNDEGIYTCLDPLQGKSLKSVRMTSTTYSSPIGVAGRLYLFDDRGDCTIIANNPNYEVLATNSLAERVQTTPAISSGQLIVRSDSHLWCIGTKSPQDVSVGISIP